MLVGRIDVDRMSHPRLRVHFSSTFNTNPIKIPGEHVTSYFDIHFSMLPEVKRFTAICNCFDIDI